MNLTRTVTGRFAPSPTGALHHGSLVTAVGSWLFARSAGGRWLLRIDDLDTQRVLPGMADTIMRTLEALGLEWDGTPLWQSRRTDAYRAALNRLERAGAIYPCGCSRAEINRIATAPHGSEELVYPGICRNGIPGDKPQRSIRVKVPDEIITFTDGIAGRCSQNLKEVCGDFVIRRADGLFAYHLATVVDDAESGVNQIVRGSDLLCSTPRQIYLQRLLETELPAYYHLPLVTGPSGTKLSKRDCLVTPDWCDTHGRETGSLILRALAFLGQDISSYDARESPAAILIRAADDFTPDLIPARSGPFGSLT